MKIIKNIKNWYKYHFINQFKFLKVLNSPFRRLRLKWYFGEITHGTPYFLPRKWVKLSKQECTDKLNEKVKYFNSLNKKCPYTIDSFKNITKPIPIKYFHWTFTSLGWKTKWTSHDYRFEWSPSLSIVIFGKQLFISILPNIEKYKRFNQDVMKINCYWESWLNWEYNTDKTKSKEERFKELIYKHSNTWGSEQKGWTDYYYHILNKKYLKLYEQILENKQSNN